MVFAIADFCKSVWNVCSSRIPGEKLRVLFLQRCVRLTQRRVQFRNAHRIEIGMLTPRSIHCFDGMHAARIVKDYLT